MNDARRPQHRRLSRAGKAAVGAAIVAFLGVEAPTVGAGFLAVGLLVAATALGLAVRHCNEDHPGMALARAPRVELSHHAYQWPDFAALGRVADRLKVHRGGKCIWGPAATVRRQPLSVPTGFPIAEPQPGRRSWATAASRYDMR